MPCTASPFRRQLTVERVPYDLAVLAYVDTAPPSGPCHAAALHPSRRTPSVECDPPPLGIDRNHDGVELLQVRGPAKIEKLRHAPDSILPARVVRTVLAGSAFEARFQRS